MERKRSRRGACKSGRWWLISAKRGGDLWSRYRIYQVIKPDRNRILLRLTGSLPALISDPTVRTMHGSYVIVRVGVFLSARTSSGRFPTLRPRDAADFRLNRSRRLPTSPTPSGRFPPASSPPREPRRHSLPLGYPLVCSPLRPQAGWGPRVLPHSGVLLSRDAPGLPRSLPPGSRMGQPARGGRRRALPASKTSRICCPCASPRLVLLPVLVSLLLLPTTPPVEGKKRKKPAQVSTLDMRCVDPHPHTKLPACSRLPTGEDISFPLSFVVHLLVGLRCLHLFGRRVRAEEADQLFHGPSGSRRKLDYRGALRTLQEGGGCGKALCPWRGGVGEGRIGGWEGVAGLLPTGGGADARPPRGATRQS